LRAVGRNKQRHPITLRRSTRIAPRRRRRSRLRALRIATRRPRPDVCRARVRGPVVERDVLAEVAGDALDPGRGGAVEVAGERVGELGRRSEQHPALAPGPAERAIGSDRDRSELKLIIEDLARRASELRRNLHVLQLRAVGRNKQRHPITLRRSTRIAPRRRRRRRVSGKRRGGRLVGAHRHRARPSAAATGARPAAKARARPGRGGQRDHSPRRIALRTSARTGDPRPRHAP